MFFVLGYQLDDLIAVVLQDLEIADVSAEGEGETETGQTGYDPYKHAGMKNGNDAGTMKSEQSNNNENENNSNGNNNNNNNNKNNSNNNNDNSKNNNNNNSNKNNNNNNNNNNDNNKNNGNSDVNNNINNENKENNNNNQDNQNEKKSNEENEANKNMMGPKLRVNVSSSSNSDTTKSSKADIEPPSLDPIGDDNNELQAPAIETITISPKKLPSSNGGPQIIDNVDPNPYIISDSNIVNQPFGDPFDVTNSHLYHPNYTANINTNDNQNEKKPKSGQSVEWCR